MMRLLVRAGHAINRRAPGLKDLLPKPLRRWLLLRVIGVGRLSEGLDRLKSRRFLEDEVLPWLGQHAARILFVGTAPYTYRYEDLFAARPGQFTTIDVNPAAAVWGAPDHIVGLIQEIGRWHPAGTFDGVVVNGVFGFGVDDPEAMRATIEAVHHVLKPGGLLVVGWNLDRHADPEGLGLYEGRFAPAEGLPWRRRMTFESETHVYDIYVRRPEVVVVQFGDCSGGGQDLGV